MNMTRPQGHQTLSFALTGRILDTSETPLSDTQPDASRATLEDRTWNWTEAAIKISINESTLRKIWWEKKLEPAFLYCPQPLRVTTRTTASGRQIAEFTAFGIEVLQAYKAAVERSDRAAEVFLAEAKAQYPAPPLAATALTLTPDPTSAQEILDGELVDSEGLLHALSTRRSTTQQTLDQTQYQTQALSEKNTRQLHQLQQLLQERQHQQQEAQHQKQAQWESEVTRETLDEFLYKQQRREELLAELEQVNRVGKPSAAAPSPAG